MTPDNEQELGHEARSLIADPFVAGRSKRKWEDVRAELEPRLKALIRSSYEAGKAAGKHEQRHQDIGVSRWIAVGDEYGYWQHPMTEKKMALTQADKKGEAE